MSQQTSIAGIDKVSLLHELWKHGEPAAFFVANSPEFSRDKAGQAIKSGDLKYVCGRFVSVQFLPDDVVDYAGYDGEYGSGKFMEILANMKSGKISKSPPKKQTGCSGFKPFGDAMLPGNPGTVMCAVCGHWKKYHIF